MKVIQVNYSLAAQLNQSETLSKINERISKKDTTNLKSRVKKILDAVPKKDSVPEWDTIK